jgi:DNA-binding transcriptional LysR family regulator
MNISIKQLRAFVTVADSQSFTKAANTLFFTQSALSVLIKELEAEVGFRLLDRTTRQVVLSDSGRDFYQLAQKLLDEFQAVIRDTSDIAMLRRGVVRVGATEAVATSLVVPAIAAFDPIQPGINVQLVNTMVSSMFNALRSGEVDFVIGPDSVQDSQFDAALQMEPLLTSPFSIWCLPNHPLANNKQVTWQQLLRNDLIIPTMDFTTHLIPLVRQHLGNEVVDRAMTLTTANRRRVTNITTALSMVKAGLGVTMAAEYISPLANAFGLEGRPLVKPSLKRIVTLYSRQGRSLSPAAMAFAEFFRLYLKEKNTL